MNPWKLMAWWCGYLGLLCGSVQAELVAHWPLDSSAEDVVGNYEGSVIGDVTFGQSGARLKTGTAARFNLGSIEVQLDPGINPTSYTFVAWAKTLVDDGNTYSVVTSREDIGPRDELYGYILYQYGGRWSHWTGDGPIGCDDIDCWDIQEGPRIHVNEWQHLAIAFDATTSTKSIFVDGTLVNATADQAYFPNFTRNLYIGSGAETGKLFYFSGFIDDVGLYNTALSEQEIQAIMLQGIDPNATIRGDFDHDDDVDVDDLNALGQEVATHANASRFDLNLDQLVDIADVSVWIKDLKNSWFGDSNLDGEFNSSDLIEVFSAGKFELGLPATWGQGDWDANGQFDSGDLVQSFQDGGFERGPRAAVAAVPEPSSIALAVAALLTITQWRRLRMHDVALRVVS